MIKYLVNATYLIVAFCYQILQNANVRAFKLYSLNVLMTSQNTLVKYVM